ncbi:DUF3732 domain-containing protein [Methanolapillus millepedarum]|uniref:Rad50/SbcC-type AAA domain-containing protein n=1 Tax=Methanolapillus millepedarum TaxID=3028296 RepID=A0AA96ZW24_9EURY|nr:hypothetical protein MsAc7_10140 [Methanosarcinaceae archaeon Ac7]
MSFQIQSLILYSNEGNIRKIDFNLNRINIVTGKSGTGKSAISQIIEYCLGGECNVPISVIRDKVSWYGLQINKNNELYFIFRKCPKKNDTSEYIYFKEGKDLPPFENVKQNMNMDGLKTFLSNLVGIVEYSNENSTTSLPTGKNEFKKSLTYCFQEQSELINKKNLFHRQDEPFIPISIRDYLPYFLGAIDENYISKLQELKKLRKELKQNENKLAEMKSIVGQNFEKASMLFVQAKGLGLYDKQKELELSNSKESATLEKCAMVVDYGAEMDGNNSPILKDVVIIQNVFQKILDFEASTDSIQTENLEFDKLEEERNKKRYEYRIIEEEIRSLNKMKQKNYNAETELKEQISRLNSIKILKEMDYNNCLCPLCSSTLETPIPTAQEISQNLKNIKSDLAAFTNDYYHLDKLIQEKEESRTLIISELNKLKKDVYAIEKIIKNDKKLKDTREQRLKLKGKIELYLESISDIKDNSQELKEKVELIQKKIERIESETDSEAIEEKLNSILSNISRDMGCFAKKLELEYSENPIRLDIKKLTVSADFKNSPITLDKMGSGHNFVGYHIVAHLALHKWFIENNRPVPSFLFIDQPSQSHYPPESTDDKEYQNMENESVLKIYNLVREVSSKYGFQVIVVDHADFKKDEKFQESIIENWYEEKLIPDEWKTDEELKLLK